MIISTVMVMVVSMLMLAGIVVIVIMVISIMTMTVIMIAYVAHTVRTAIPPNPALTLALPHNLAVTSTVDVARTNITANPNSAFCHCYCSCGWCCLYC